ARGACPDTGGPVPRPGRECPSASRARPALGVAAALLRPRRPTGDEERKLRSRPEPRAPAGPGYLPGGGGEPSRISPRHGPERGSSESSASSPLVPGATDLYASVG